MRPDEALNSAFEDCLHAVQGGQATVEECLATHPQHAQELAPLLALALDLGTLPRPQMADERVAAVRREVVAHALELAARRPTARRGWLLPLFSNHMARLGAVLGLVLALVIASGVGTATAAGQALPGQPLYPLKRGLEQARLILTPEEEQPQVLVSIAQERLEEVEELATGGDVAQGVIDDLLAATDAALDGLEDTSGDEYEELAADLSELTEQQEEILMELLDSAPQEAEQGLMQALQASQQGRERASAANAQNGNRGTGQPDGDGPPGQQVQGNENNGSHGPDCELPPCTQDGGGKD